MIVTTKDFAFFCIATSVLIFYFFNKQGLIEKQYFTELCFTLYKCILINKFGIHKNRRKFNKSNGCHVRLFSAVIVLSGEVCVTMQITSSMLK